MERGREEWKGGEKRGGEGRGGENKRKNAFFAPMNGDTVLSLPSLYGQHWSVWARQDDNVLLKDGKFQNVYPPRGDRQETGW